MDTGKKSWGGTKEGWGGQKGPPDPSGSVGPEKANRTKDIKVKGSGREGQIKERRRKGQSLIAKGDRDRDRDRAGRHSLCSHRLC